MENESLFPDDPIGDPPPPPSNGTTSKGKRNRTLKKKTLADCVLTFGELETLEIPERPSLVPWLPGGGLAMIYGPRGIGKTYLSLSMALALSTGQDFMKWPVKKAVGGLIIDGEMSLADLRNRILDMKIGEPETKFHILSHEQYFNLTETDLDLGKKECQEAVEVFLENTPHIQVVILDNLSSLFPRLREDKRDDWVTIAMPFLLWLRRRGIATVLIHHSGKGGDQRGTSSREDSLDTVIQLSWGGNQDENRGANFILRFTKHRSCFGDDVAPFEATLVPDPEGAPSWELKPVDEGMEERLLRVVKDGFDTVNGAAAELGISPGYVSKLKKGLQEKGELKPGIKLEAY